MNIAEFREIVHKRTSEQVDRLSQELRDKVGEIVQVVRDLGYTACEVEDRPERPGPIVDTSLPGIREIRSMPYCGWCGHRSHILSCDRHVSVSACAGVAFQRCGCYEYQVYLCEHDMQMGLCGLCYTVTSKQPAQPSTPHVA